MKDWVAIIENEFVGQIIFRKLTNDSGEYCLSVEVYDQGVGFFAHSIMVCDNKEMMDANFECLLNEENNKTINSIAERLIMF